MWQWWVVVVVMVMVTVIVTVRGHDFQDLVEQCKWKWNP
jgi:hypothetical protein